MVVCVHTHQEVRHMLSAGNNMNGVVIHQVVSYQSVVVCVLVLSPREV